MTQPSGPSANELRLQANEICRLLFEQDAVEQLKILHSYIEIALRYLAIKNGESR